MIFHLFSRVVVKLGEDEKHVYDRGRLMYTEVAEIQKVTEWSYGEWEQRLGQYDIVAVAALVHVLRKRDNMPSDFATMQFNAADLDVVPVHDSGEEFTPEEVAKDLAERMKKATAEVPTSATDETVAPEGTALPTPETSTPGSSPSGSGSGPGNGTGSATPTSSGASPTSTPS